MSSTRRGSNNNLDKVGIFSIYALYFTDPVRRPNKILLTTMKRENEYVHSTECMMNADASIGL